MKSKRLKVLNDEWRDCTKCSLASVRTQVVFGSGNPDARLVVVGEAPGRDEDTGGALFIGETGQLFDKILAAVDIKREDIWITNTCLCRPKVDKNGRENRAPSMKEINACRPRIKEEMSIVQPKMVVLMGATPLLMATKKRGIIKNRGWVIRTDKLRVYATLHPRSLLHGSAEQIHTKKKMVWEDWQEIAKEYNEA
jgi:uracil-DNA glycosylase